MFTVAHDFLTLTVAPHLASLYVSGLLVVKTVETSFFAFWKLALKYLFVHIELALDFIWVY